ncbi:hypothetical protein C7C45_07810 [Micromonospora arborensis]|uniref:Uncharacterized protein n=1 Tax=Micromonospora arborensis TaxID=2116518 RepID=A0A318P5Y1_9ACTN|nr:hypothetical protein C7C45_07810 [Micromonospora arborensis]
MLAVLPLGPAAAFAVSQWPRSLVAAPWLDWFLVWLLVGVVCLASVVLDRSVHPFSSPRVVGGRLTAGKVQWVASMATLATVVLLCGCGSVQPHDL